MAVVDHGSRTGTRPQSSLVKAWVVLKRAVEESLDDRVPMVAQALAYSLFLAIPATALVALGLFSLVADQNLIEDLLDKAGTVMPAEATDLLRDSLERSARSTGGGIAMTIFGLALGVWTTTSAATTLMEAVNRAYDRDDERGFVRKRLIALLIVFALVVSAFLVVTFLVLGPHVEHWLGDAMNAERATAWAWWTAQWPILLAALLFAFALVLYLAPDVGDQRWTVVVPGAAVAVVGWLAASAGFALYAAYFGSYNKTWGTLSAVVITLVWLWLTSAALLFGAEVNSEARALRDERRVP